MPLPKLLVLIDSLALREQVETLEALKQYEVRGNYKATEIIAALDLEKPDVVLCFVDKDVDQQLSHSTDLIYETHSIFLSNGTPYEALDKLMGQGAAYHFRAPFDTCALNEVLTDFAENFAAGSIRSRKKPVSSLDQFGLLVGSSACMRQLYRSIHRVADSLANVLILGESGSGKELVAKTVHLMSSRRDAPYIAINCGAISPELVDSELFGHKKGAFTGAAQAREGLFAQAEGGTLFLDEITEMPIEQQVKLLRVLETGEYRAVGSEETLKANVRIIAASNRDPSEAIRDDLLREDLYYRLSHFPLHVPPLRDREGDIEGLATHFLSYRNQQENTQIPFDPKAIEKLKQHEWPGNVRELKHTIERAYILAQGMIAEDDIQFEAPIGNELQSENSVPVGVPLEEIEKEAITRTLEDNSGNKSDTAEQLGISVKTLYNKLEKYKQEDAEG